MSHNCIISVEHLSKYYNMYSRKWDRLLEVLDPWRRPRHTDFRALDDISFSVAPGESLGIVGINGSGKSTLLKLLCGVTTPTSGRITVRGRVAALLELGAGFHPERTGLQNLYFQGAIQGFTQAETIKMLPDILDFADIGEFINQPVKIYSSGMFVRLAFAAAIQTHPDILVVDEALAVGDVRFQRKCFARIEEMKREGVTFIFVSHATEQIISQCSRAILLSRGQILQDGEPRDVVNQYLDILFGRSERLEDQQAVLDLKATDIEEKKGEESSQGDPVRTFLANRSTEDVFASNPWYNQYEYRWGNEQARILDAFLVSSGDAMHIRPGDKLDLYVKVHFLTACYRPIWGCTIKNQEGVTVYGSNSEINGMDVPYESVSAGQLAYVRFSFCCHLAPGNYFISLGVALNAGDTPLERRYDSLLLTVHGPANFFGLGDVHMTIDKGENAHG